MTGRLTAGWLWCRRRVCMLVPAAVLAYGVAVVPWVPSLLPCTQGIGAWTPVTGPPHPSYVTMLAKRFVANEVVHAYAFGWILVRAKDLAWKPDGRIGRSHREALFYRQYWENNDGRVWGTRSPHAELLEAMLAAGRAVDAPLPSCESVGHWRSDWYWFWNR